MMMMDLNRPARIAIPRRLPYQTLRSIVTNDLKTGLEIEQTMSRHIHDAECLPDKLGRNYCATRPVVLQQFG